jgi:hypothetical protein
MRDEVAADGGLAADHLEILDAGGLGRHHLLDDLARALVGQVALVEVDAEVAVRVAGEAGEEHQLLRLAAGGRRPAGPLLLLQAAGTSTRFQTYLPFW